MHKFNHEKSITLVINSYPNFTGGAEVFNHFLIKEIAKKHKVILISSSDPGIKGIKEIKFYKLKQLKPTRLFYPIQLLFLLCKTSINSDCIYTCFMKSSWLVFIPITIFSFFFKVPYTFTIHGGGMMKWRIKLPFILFFSRAKAITGVSERICDEYKNRTGLVIKYLPPLIPFKETIHSKIFLRSKYHLPIDAKIFLFVGSLKPLKNPLNIVKALQLIGHEYVEQNKLVLVYSGNGVLNEEIGEFVVKNELKDYVYLPGNIPLESVHEMYALADYYIICSEFEGTPIALLEAMFNSLPVLASDAPGINNLLEHNLSAILYKTDNITKLADGIKELISNPQKVNYISQNANKYFTEHFNYQSIVDEYINVITL